MKPLLWQSINVCVFVFIGSSYPPSNFGDAAINKKLPISLSLHSFLLFFLFISLEYFAMRKTIVLSEEDLGESHETCQKITLFQTKIKRKKF